MNKKLHIFSHLRSILINKINYPQTQLLGKYLHSPHHLLLGVTDATFNVMEMRGKYIGLGIITSFFSFKYVSKEGGSYNLFQSPLVSETQVTMFALGIDS